LTFLEAFASELAFSLKERDLAWDIITVHIRHTDFATKSHQSKLPNMINTSDEIYTAVIKLFDELWKWEEINMIWISIWGLKKAIFKQRGLF
jgi:nucleotidyltransferase/DNA polymerase involved in DNA repair